LTSQSFSGLFSQPDVMRKTHDPASEITGPPKLTRLPQVFRVEQSLSQAIIVLKS